MIRYRGPLDPSRWKRVLVIAPHPDDETLATGGLLQRSMAAGGAVRVVFVTTVRTIHGRSVWSNGNGDSGRAFAPAGPNAGAPKRSKPLPVSEFQRRVPSFSTFRTRASHPCCSLEAEASYRLWPRS
jgi:hypothetical protein